MNITVRHRHDIRRVTTATAAPTIAAVLRVGGTVTVHEHPNSTRWTLRARNGHVEAAVANPDLFIADPPPPGWVERLAAAAAALL